MIEVIIALACHDDHVLHDGDHDHRQFGWRDPRVTEALRRLVGAGRDRDLPVIMPVFSPDPSECRDLVESWRAEGVSHLMIGSDKILIANAFADWRGAIPV